MTGTVENEMRADPLYRAVSLSQEDFAMIDELLMETMVQEECLRMRKGLGKLPEKTRGLVWFFCAVLAVLSVITMLNQL